MDLQSVNKLKNNIGASFNLNFSLGQLVPDLQFIFGVVWKTVNRHIYLPFFHCSQLVCDASIISVFTITLKFKLLFILNIFFCFNNLLTCCRFRASAWCSINAKEPITHQYMVWCLSSQSRIRAGRATPQHVFSASIAIIC